MNGFLASHDGLPSLFLISYNDPGLFSELRDIPLQRFLQPVVVENGGVQRLGQAAKAFQRGLRDLADLR